MSPINGGLKGAVPPGCPHNLWFQWPCPCALVGTWGIFLALKPKIVGVADPNTQWGHFVYPSSSQKRKSTAFELILRGAWGFLVPVSKLVEVVLYVGKGAKFGVEKVHCGQNICNRDVSVWNGKNFEKQAQSSKG